jgi:putative oxidoreductase
VLFADARSRFHKNLGEIMRGVISALSAQSGFGYLLVRLVSALILFYSGYNKVFVTGLSGVSGFFEKINMPVPQVTGPFIGLLELIGGALLFVGLFTRYLGVLFTIEFIVATWAKFGPMDQGLKGAEIDLMLLVAGLLFATNGAGKFSLDAVFRRWDA